MFLRYTQKMIGNSDSMKKYKLETKMKLDYFTCRVKDER